MGSIEYGTSRVAVDRTGRRITKDSLTNRVEVRDPETVKVTDEPLQTSGPIRIEVPAKTYKWWLDPHEVEDALRPYIHDKLRHLPSNHFLKVEPKVDAEGDFIGIEFTVVIPEKQ